MIKNLNIPKVIYLHDTGLNNLDFGKLKGFIRGNFGGIKVNLSKAKKEAVKTKGLLFDFRGTLDAFVGLRSSRVQGACHIIFSDKIFATLDTDKRPHIRAAIFGYPSVISTSGIVEGPAKPKEYYLYKQKFSQLGTWDMEEPVIKKKFHGRFIDYGDKRITEVVKGYVSQALFYYLSEEPFCGKKSCRLFNAHWQEDMIYSQIKIGSFCPNHKEILPLFKEKLCLVKDSKI